MRKPMSLIALCLLILGYSWSKEKVDARLKARLHNVDIRYLPTPELAKFLSIGFESALADVYWIEGINYYGSELLTKQRDYKYLQAYCDLILALDPYFTSFYDWASTAFIYTGLEVTRDSIVNSTRYINKGIENLNKVYRYSSPILLKGGFNYVLESLTYLPGLTYFAMDARSFSNQRDMFLVAATYASHASQPSMSAEFKLEYLGNIAFEAQTKDEIRYALRVMSSSGMNSKSAEFVRGLRLKLESDDEVRKLVEKRLSENPILQGAMLKSEDLFADRRLTNVLSIDLQKTWLPTEMLVLFSL